MASEQRRYLAYLLRLWHATDNDGTPGWRASVEEIYTSTCRGLGSLEQVLTLLLEETAGTLSSHAEPEAPLP